MLAIIPARGGSKGIPKKNTKNLLGKPLILYTIEEAKKSKKLDRILLSTDDQQIAKIALDNGIDVPFMRPANLAGDDSLAIDTYLYTIEKLNTDFNQNYEDIIILQPTSPLRTYQDIDAAIEIFQKKKADSVISVSDAVHPPIWAKKIDEYGVLRNYFNMMDGISNRQEIEKAYIPNGAIFIFNLKFLTKNRTYYSSRSFPYVMPRERSVDIDDNYDFEFAEFLMRKYGEHK